MSHLDRLNRSRRRSSLEPAPKRIGVGLAASVAVVLCAAPAAAANLVVNGGFENPVIAPPYLINTTPTAWTGTGDMVVQGYAGSVSSGDGNQWWDLNPGFNAGTGLSQDVNLVAGKKYTFSFIYNGGGGGSTTAISYNIGGDLSGSVSTASLNVYNGSAWQTLTKTFVSSVTGPETLHFQPNGSWSGGFIDKVQLVGGGAPEPAAWSLMILGAGLAGVGLRRSRRRAC